MRKKISAVVAVAVGVAAVAALLGRAPDDPEARIRAVLAEVVTAAEKRDLGGIMEHVSRGFGTAELDRDGLKGLLFVQLRRGEWRRVVLVQTEVHLTSGDVARVDVVAMLASGDTVTEAKDLLATDADAFRFDIQMALEEDDAWRATAVTYAPVRANDLLRR